MFFDSEPRHRIECTVVVRKRVQGVADVGAYVAGFAARQICDLGGEVKGLYNGKMIALGEPVVVIVRPKTPGWVKFARELRLGVSCRPAEHRNHQKVSS